MKLYVQTVYNILVIYSSKSPMTRVSFIVMEKQMTQMLRFKVKTTPNKATVRKMLQALFLRHFNGFILHAWNVCCLSRNLHYIFED